MNRLWTPWRMQYVTGSTESTSRSERSYIFLDALESASEPDSLVVHRGQLAFVIMNLFPYNTGHMMVVPNRRVQSLEELTSDERAEMMELVSSATEVANRVLRCDGFNIGLNIGSVAGAGIAEHLHMHIVPRWLGDANFMPISAETMVLPELLPATAARIKGEFASREARRRDPTVRSTAGAIVYLPTEKQIVLRRAKDGTIVLPKGHIEAEESAADAAIREVEEETGVAATITQWAGIDEFEHRGNRFHAVYFFGVGTRTPAVDDHLERDTLLIDVDSAVDSLSFPASRQLMERCVAFIRRSNDHHQP
ncbi:hypothetical protein BH23CHL2_BH23CHL2_00260 [soil metagenome]